MGEKLFIVVLVLLHYCLFTTADCVHDSRHPHSGNCEHYYRCIYGTLYELSCPDGLHFNVNTADCDSPDNANCKNEDECVNDDLLPHAESCELFYKCSEGTLQVLSCPDGLHFNPIAKQCDWPAEAKCAIGEHTCVDGDLFPHAESCQLFYQCSGASLQVQSCPDGLHFDSIGKQCDWPAVAKCAVTEDKCVDGDLFPHEGSCQMFYQCSGASLELQSCPEGLHFSPTGKFCDWPEEAKCENTAEKCTDGDLYAHKESCELFYQCSGGSLHVQSCPAGLHFNSVGNTCDFPEEAQCDVEKEKCTDGDLLPYSEACDQFFLCVQGGLYLLSCPDRHHFDANEKLCVLTSNFPGTC
ncbi:probable chitinase 10 isoform X1 [Bradysia coprophila]|uniref:probable chitinase 10 isoform X1 n=1 Tax=Bradysia coprophila TaxID=38358 RepID=UPI00187DB7CB|nr:probable chitinase 10 isoform X1 [Bradysia coprophila]